MDVTVRNVIRDKNGDIIRTVEHVERNVPKDPDDEADVLANFVDVTRRCRDAAADAFRTWVDGYLSAKRTEAHDAKARGDANADAIVPAAIAHATAVRDKVQADICRHNACIDAASGALAASWDVSFTTDDYGRVITVDIRERSDLT